MRIRLVPTMAVLACLCAPTSARAQGSIPFYVDGGVTLPAGKLNDAWSTGFNVGGGVGFPVLSRLDLRADLAYSRMPLDEDAVLGGAGGGAQLSGGAIGSFTALGLAQLRLAGPHAAYHPYLLAGTGYWRLTPADLTVTDSTGSVTLYGESTNGMAFALGAGASFDVAPGLGLFLEGRYVVGWDFRDPPDLDDTWVPLSAGIVLNP